MSDKPAKKRRYPGKIDQLPAATRNWIKRALDQGMTQADITRTINDELQAQGQEPISKHSVNRWTKTFLAAGKEMDEARLAAKAWSEAVGSIDNGEVDAYMVEQVRLMAVKHIHRHGDLDAWETKEITDLALAVQRLIKTQAAADARIRAIRLETEKRVTETVKAVKRNGGITKAGEKKILEIFAGAQK